MEAIVLAGGFGTRLRQIVSDVPKPMAPIVDRPFLEILLTNLAVHGFTRVILALGYMADKIINHFGDSFAGMQLIYEIEDQPLGTGGAVRLAIAQCLEDHVFVFNGDTYLDLEIDKVELQWQQYKQPIMVARKVDDTARYGRLELNENQIVGFLEKGLSGQGLINAGTYVLPTSILDDFQIGQTFSLETDFFIPFVKQDRLGVFITEGKFIDIGIPEDYMLAQTLLVNVGK